MAGFETYSTQDSQGSSKGVIDIVHARYDKVSSKYDYDKCERTQQSP